MDWDVNSEESSVEEVSASKASHASDTFSFLVS